MLDMLEKLGTDITKIRPYGKGSPSFTLLNSLTNLKGASPLYVGDFYCGYCPCLAGDMGHPALRLKPLPWLQKANLKALGHFNGGSM